MICRSCWFSRKRRVEMDIDEKNNHYKCPDCDLISNGIRPDDVEAFG